MENLTENQNRETSRKHKRVDHKTNISDIIFAPKETEKRYSFKFARKVVHVSFSIFGFIFLFSPEILYKHIAAIILYSSTILAFIADTIRIFIPIVNKIVYKYLNMLFIQRDKQRYSSGTYYLLGAAITTLLFPYSIAGMGIIFLGIGDFMASLGGTYLKRYFPYQMPKTHKTWIGLICFIVSTSTIGYFANIPLWACIVSSMLAGLCEVYLVRIDDNLSIPVAGSLCLYLLTIGF